MDRCRIVSVQKHSVPPQRAFAHSSIYVCAPRGAYSLKLRLTVTNAKRYQAVAMETGSLCSLLLLLTTPYTGMRGRWDNVLQVDSTRCNPQYGWVWLLLYIVELPLLLCHNACPSQPAVQITAYHFVFSELIWGTASQLERVPAKSWRGLFLSTPGVFVGSSLKRPIRSLKGTMAG